MRLIMSDDVNRRLGQLENGQEEIRRDVEQLKASDERLEKANVIIVQDIAAIKERLNQTPTKTDLSLAQAQISADFHTMINGVLKDALQAVPGKYMLMLCGISGIVGLAAFLISRVHG